MERNSASGGSLIMGQGQVGSVTDQVRRLFGEGTVVGLSEWELLRRYLDRRDEEAFRAIVVRHGPMVMGVCRRVLDDASDVEDAFQVTFLTLARKASKLGPSDVVGQWLHGVAYRVALRARTSAARRRSRERLGPSPEPSSFDAPADRELGQVIDEELARLPSKYRAPVVLCYLDGLTHEEAGRHLGWPVGTVKGRLARARLLLKSRLARRGISPSAASPVVEFLRKSGTIVPASVADRTARAALDLASGVGAGLVSASAAALMNQGLPAMFLTRSKLIAAVLLTLATGAAVMAYQAAKEPAAKPGGARVPAAPEGKAPKPTPTLGEWMTRLAEPDSSPEGRAILDAIEEPFSMNFPNDTPLEDLLKYIRQASQRPKLPNGIPIYVDPQGLQDANMASTVSLELEGIPLKTTLRLALAQLGLFFEVKDGLMTITSTSREDRVTPLDIIEQKAEDGELTMEQYKELIEILKLRNEVTKLLREKKALESVGAQ